MERNIFLRNTKKTRENHKFGRNKGFLEFHLIYNGNRLKLLGSLLLKK